MFKRLKICWMALTKKNYATFFYNKNVYGPGGTRLFISDGARSDSKFLIAIQKYLADVNKLNIAPEFDNIKITPGPDKDHVADTCFAKWFLDNNFITEETYLKLINYNEDTSIR